MTRRRSPPPASPYGSLTDGELIELLYTSADQLPREAADELLRRSRRILPSLSEIVTEKTSWTQPVPEWWAAVHATYLLGASESPEALTPLLAALRWADAFDCDWVTEDLPSILGRIGRIAFEPLRAVARDPSAGGGARSIALASLVAVSLPAPFVRDEVLEYAAEVLRSAAEPLVLRQTAANVLLDLRARKHRDLLLRFGREEAKRRKEDPDYQGVFYDWEVDELLSEADEAGLDYYRRDWLTFYDPEEIAHRQERWEREREEAEREKAEESGPRPRSEEPCACGSGRAYAECCFLKVH